MKHTLLHVRPGEMGEPVQVDLMDNAQRRKLLNDKQDVDFGMLSRRFHYVVYEHSITDKWPLNWAFFANRNGPIPVCGPALIFKANEIGDTVDLTPVDVEALRDWIAAARFGLIIDSLTLDEAS